MKNLFSILTPVLIAVQETWFLPSDPYNFQLSNYTLYRHDELFGQRRHGGVALYVQNDFTHSQLNIDTDLQAIACTMYINGRNIDICSIYIPPNFETAELLRHLNHLVAQFRHPFLLLGDFNAHSPSWWDGQSLDARGRIVEDVIDIHRLITLNDNQPTHFNLSHNSESAIDLSLSSPCLAPWFQWVVDSDIHDSDHYPILLRFTFGVAGGSSFVPRWNLNKADWATFTELCEFTHHDRFVNPLDGISYITDTIITAAKQSIPVTKPCKKGNAVPWWSPSVRQAIARRKRAFRAYLRLRTDEALVARNRERAIAKRVIKTAKRNSWQKFLSAFTSSTPLNKLWDLVRRLSGKRISLTFPILRLPDTGEIVSEPNAVVNCLAERISHTSSEARYRPGFLDIARRRFQLDVNAFHSDNLEDYNTLFTIHELNDAIYSAGNTSVGPDELHYSFFRHLSESSKLFLLQTFNDLFCNQLFPDHWKESTVIALLKPGRARQDANNYRPIALTSCLGKLLERMISKRLSFILEHHRLLTKFQSGFRKHHSTVDHLIRLESDIRKGYKKKQHTSVIFLDIKNAYDMVFRPALLHKIHQLGIRGHLAHYLGNFLSGTRRFRLKHRSIFSNFYETETGLPQGSCLSPILFNIMINDLFHDIPQGISFSLFADDSAIWFTSPDFDIGIQRLQTALHRVEHWSAVNGLEFSAEKSALMIFSKSRRSMPARLPTLNNTPIPLLSHFKFLGVVLDSRLTMHQHVKHLQLKCQRRFNLFKCLTSTPVGADRITLLRLYKAIVLPIIEYGCAMYAGGTSSTLHKLEAIQNNFLRLALGVPRTSPVQSLQVDANVLPLYIRRIDLTFRYYAKIRLFPDHAASTAITVLPRLHFNYLGRCEKRTGLTIASRIKKYEGDLGYQLPDMPPLPPFPTAPWMVRPLAISFLHTVSKRFISPTEVQQIFLTYQNDHAPFSFVYTDASKYQDHTAIGIYSPGLLRARHRLEDHTSVFSAELYAIFIALQLIQQHHIQQACICSDSKSSLQSLQRFTVIHHLHIKIFALHQQLCDDGADIKFLWCPGHSGISGNETADIYAKEALALPHVSPTIFDYHTLRSSVTYKCIQFWQRVWTTQGAGTHLHQIKPHIGFWSSSSRPSRREEKVLARLRIGHTYFTHSFIFNRRPRPTCSRCRTALSVEHFLLHCSKYNTERQHLHVYCRMNSLPFTLAVLLGNDHPELLKLLFSYLIDTTLLGRL